MDLQLIGSDELLYIQTEKASITIKGRSVHPVCQDTEYSEGDSVLRVYCREDYQLAVRNSKGQGRDLDRDGSHMGIYPVRPLFFEQQQYNGPKNLDQYFIF